MTSITASASSPTTSTRCARRPARPVDAPCRPSLLSVACGSSRQACSSGTSPKTSPVTTARPSVRPSTRTSSDTVSRRGTLGGARASNPRSAATASPTPRAAPANVSTRFSIRNWRASRDRLAPSASRTATSRARPRPLMRSRLATFTQPTSSTRPTAPHNISRAGRAGPNTTESSGSTNTPRPSFSR